MKYATRILVYIIVVSKSQEFLLKVRRLFIFFRRRWRHLHVDASSFFWRRRKVFDFDHKSSFATPSCLLGTLSFTFLNITHPSDHSHLCSL